MSTYDCPYPTNGSRGQAICISPEVLACEHPQDVAAGEAGMTTAYRPSPTARRGYAAGPFGLIHYHDTGGDGRPVLLCHQSPQTSRQFDAVLPELAARGLRAIAIDTPGFGMSDPPDFVPRIEDYATAIPPVLDALGLARADLVGHHTGAQIVTEAALAFPTRVANLVLNGPNPMTAEERRVALAEVQSREIDMVYAEDGAHLTQSFAIRWNFYGPGGDPRLTTRVVAEKFIGYGPFWYGHHAAFRHDHAASLLKITHRTMILTNTGDVIHEAAQAAHRLRPDFAFVALAGGTIDIVDQQPAAWADAVATFVKGG